MENKYLNELILLAKRRKIPHAVIIEGKDLRVIDGYLTEIFENALCVSEEVIPCKKCSACIKIKAKSHPDIKIISPEKDAKSIKIDSIRKIREDAYVISNEGGYKFYVITHGELMTIQAQNAFIKILEEPPKGVVFIICTDSSSSLLGTVRSRCQIFKCQSEDNEDSEMKNLAEEFSDAVLENDKAKILSIGAKIPNDRVALKKLSFDVIELLLKKYVLNKNNTTFDSAELINKINSLKSVADMSERNVNFNLLICYMCAQM